MRLTSYVLNGYLRLTTQLYGSPERLVKGDLSIQVLCTYTV